MIDITRSTRFKIQISEIDFKALINESLTQLRNLEGAHKMEVKTTIESFLPFYSDYRQLNVIFNNIISNAIKYQHAHEMHPQLDIHIEVDAEKATMTFKDNGIGIEPVYKQKIFEKFFRVPNFDRHNIKGYGLGLSYVSHIAKMHMGYVEVETEPGKGSRFSVKIPIEEKDVIHYDRGRIARKIKIG